MCAELCRFLFLVLLVDLFLYSFVVLILAVTTCVTNVTSLPLLALSVSTSNTM